MIMSILLGKCLVLGSYLILKVSVHRKKENGPPDISNCLLARNLLASIYRYSFDFVMSLKFRREKPLTLTALEVTV